MVIENKLQIEIKIKDRKAFKDSLKTTENLKFEHVALIQGSHFRYKQKLELATSSNSNIQIHFQPFTKLANKPHCKYVIMYQEVHHISPTSILSYI